jgi:hypothetical protein
LNPDKEYIEENGAVVCKPPPSMIPDGFIPDNSYSSSSFSEWSKSHPNGKKKLKGQLLFAKRYIQNKRKIMDFFDFLITT